MTTQNESNKKTNYHSEHDPESLHVVRGKYQNLQDVIASLNDKLNYVADFQEKEFLSAYRVHMLSVQLELKELQEKVAKAEMLLQDDGEVSKLEEECNWFRNETNRLQTHSAAMQHDIQALRTRLTALRDQNQYLSSQLKAVMKRSRVLEVEIDMVKQNAESHQQDQATEGSRASSRQNSYRDNQHHDFDEDDDISALDQEEQVDGGMGKSLSAIALGNRPQQLNSLRRVQSLGPDVLLPLNPRATSPSQSPSRGISSRRTGKNTTGRLAQSASTQASKDYPSEIKSLRKQLNSLTSSRSDLELQIEENIRGVFQNVVKRKSLAVARNSKNRYFQSLAKQADASGQDSIDQELHSIQFSSKTPIERLGYPVVGGITDLGLQHFTDVDRKEVMINLFSNPEIFEEVVKSLGYNYPIL